MRRARGWRHTQPPCPKCGRGFDNPVSMEQHLRDSHDTTLTEAARDYEAIKKPDTNEFFEHALVKIANSGSHDDAVEIATAALLGEDL